MEESLKNTAASYSPLVLAYMGDAVYELMIRERIVRQGNRQVNRLHRNAHSHTTAKNASVIDYRMATGFEALVGYLWLSEQKERLRELVETALSKLEEEEKHERERN